MGYNRSGTKFVARMKRRRREAMRLATKATGMTGKGTTVPAGGEQQKKTSNIK